jgi:hypothetical protein
VACQKTDWKKRHKKICKHLNVGHGDMQVRTPIHTCRSITIKEQLESLQHSRNDNEKLFFRHFEESTFEGSRAAALKMKEFVKRQTKDYQKYLLFQNLHFLIRTDSEMLSWPNSPLLVLLKFLDPNMLSGDDDASLQQGQTRSTPLHQLANLVDPSDYSTHENQLILAKQLIEHGANVNAVAIPDSKTSLHIACSGTNVTNLDFVELLLKEGADPNVQDHLGMTPLI